jgi:hypothetical protein
MRIKSLLLIFLSLTPLLSGCSVVMSARKSGSSIEDISSCTTRNCLLTKSAVPLSHVTRKDGRLISEDFKVQQPKGSVARAGMHGALDVATGGLWEVIGTPIEIVEGQKKYYIIHVTYKADGQHLASVRLAQK